MKFVPSWLQQLGQGAQGLPMLQSLPGANPVGQMDPRTMAEVMAEMYSSQDNLAIADRLSSAEYARDSGIGGAIAMGLQAFAGKKLRDKSQGKLSDLLREKSDLLSRQEREELARKRSEAEAEYQRKIAAAQEAGYTPGQAKALAEGVPLPKSADPKVMKVGNQLVQIGADGKPKVLHEAPRAPQGGAETPASIRELQAYLALTPEQQKAFDRLQGREVGPAQLSAKDQQAQQLRGVSAEQADTLIGQLEGMSKQGVGGPIAGRVPGALSSVFNPDVEKYETTRAQLVDEITRLRRVPGIGAQSDLELRTALAAIPGVETNEGTRAQAFANLRQVIARVREELGQKPAGISGRADASGWSIQAIE